MQVRQGNVYGARWYGQKELSTWFSGVDLASYNLMRESRGQYRTYSPPLYCPPYKRCTSFTAVTKKV